MKKVLLVGKLNQTVSSVNRHLATRFQTQICVDELEMVKGMVEVFDPDLTVISLIGVGELNKSILDYLQEKCSNMPVLLLGTKAECHYYHSYYDKDKQFDYAVRPITLSVLMKKCLEMLHIGGVELNDELEVKKIENRRKRVLAVDDSGVLLRSVKAILEKEYDVSVATSGPMAMKQAKKNMPDLILLDYEMPEWDGKRTLEEFRNDEELKDIPVVFLTGVADRAHIMAVLNLKPEGYLLKPIEQERLFDTIHDVLAGVV